MYRQEYYTHFFEYGQQQIHFDLFKFQLPEDDPVFTLIKIMEDLDYTKLLAQYSGKGRKGYNPIMMFAVILYANMKGIRAVDRIVELCQRDLAFIWLTKGKKPKRDAFFKFKNDKLTQEVLSELHYQFMNKLKSEGYLTLDSLFIDGTKIEANANKYTFVWRGTVNYHLALLVDRAEKFFEQYNNLIKANKYDKKYSLEELETFQIEGIEKIKRTIKENKTRKAKGINKLPNNTIIEINKYHIATLLKAQQTLKKLAISEKTEFVFGKGKRKTEIQKLYEEVSEIGARLLKYKNIYEIMGIDRNSFSKTDNEATFMRMKDDHMMNGQLKAGYNVQIIVENYFIIHSYVSNDRTDYNTLIPVLEKHKEKFGTYPKEITADSGYCSEKNLSYLKNNDITSYIKLQTHEKRKTREYSKEIGKYYNMKKVVDEEEYYICYDNRKIKYQYTEKRKHKTGDYYQNYNVYSCDSCSGCKHKEKCLYKYDPIKDIDKNKTMKVNENWHKLQEETHKNIQSEKGIINRQIRSIQTEGHFGDLKENDQFRRFNYRGEEKVFKEFFIYIFGRNINKYHRFIHGEIKEFTVKQEEKLA